MTHDQTYQLTQHYEHRRDSNAYTSQYQALTWQESARIRARMRWAENQMAREKWDEFWAGIFGVGRK